MPITNDPTSIANVALGKIGAQAITSISDNSSASAIACNTQFNLCYEEVSRSGRWNCLLTTSVLTNVPQTPLPWTIAGTSTTITATAWAPLTAYLANVYVTFGGYYYQVAFNYTSTVSFANDLTTGALVQTDQPTSGNVFGLNNGSQYPSGWGYQYLLPGDFLLLGVLNGNVCWDLDGSGSSDDYQIMAGAPTFPITNPPQNKVACLFTDAPNAVVEYVPNQPDTTQWDSLFANAMSLKLASAISTTLRQDGGRLEAQMIQAYEKALRTARQRNGGEQQSRRFNAIPSSRFNQARWGGVNGHLWLPECLAKLLR